MKLHSSIASLAMFAVVLVSCERQASNPPPSTQAGENALSADYQTPDKVWSEDEFTPWQSRAELQMSQNETREDQYFAGVQGRDNHGRSEYRAVIKQFPSDKFDQWAVFWGIDEKELYDWELRLMRAGFVRSYMQVFRDGEGHLKHQIVWLKPKGAQPRLGNVEMVDEPSPLTSTSTGVTDSMPAPVTQAPTPSVAATDVAEPEAPQTVANASASPEKPAQAAVANPPVEEVTPRAKPVVEEVKAETKKDKSVYRVVPGDTLSKIARKNGTTVQAIKKANRLRSDMLRIGQKLVIP